jgi:histidine triad (HIT) family protein
MACLFCGIADGHIPSKKVYEDDDVLAILDARPVAPGHTLLIPKTHTARIEDLTPEQAAALFKALHMITGPIREAASCDATTIGINNGPGSGQEIPHVHIHIIPRRRGDHGGIIQQLGPGGAGDPAKIAEAIRARINKDTLRR